MRVDQLLGLVGLATDEHDAVDLRTGGVCDTCQLTYCIMRQICKLRR